MKDWPEMVISDEWKKGPAFFLDARYNFNQKFTKKKNKQILWGQLFYISVFHHCWWIAIYYYIAYCTTHWYIIRVFTIFMRHILYACKNTVLQCVILHCTFNFKHVVSSRVHNFQPYCDLGVSCSKRLSRMHGALVVWIKPSWLIPFLYTRILMYVYTSPRHECVCA